MKSRKLGIVAYVVIAARWEFNSHRRLDLQED